MTDYTPTTEDVQAAYGGRAVLGTPAMAANYEEAEAQFDRWLAAHDAKVKAEALREAADALLLLETMANSRWLRVRADKIEKGSTDE